MALRKSKSGIYQIDKTINGKRVRVSAGTDVFDEAARLEAKILNPDHTESKFDFELDKDEIVSRSRLISKVCGIYFLIDKNDVVYVGQSVHIQKRISEHITLGRMDFDRFSFIDVPKHLLDDVEMLYIKKFRPCYNVSGNDVPRKDIKKKNKKTLIAFDELAKFASNVRFENVLEPGRDQDTDRV